MKRILIFILLNFLGVISGYTQDLRTQLRQIASDLAKQIEVKGKKRVVIASFLDLKNQETELGRYMSDKFSIGMSTATSLEITDRSQLAQLLRDNKLAAERILDPKTIPTLGKLTGAEVIITGNYTALDNSVDITVKAIELERGLRLAVAEGAIPRTSEINKLLNEIDQASSEMQTISSGRTTSNTSKITLPKPSIDCSTKNTCVVCVTNKTSVNIKAQPSRSGLITYYIHPEETKCWKEFSIDSGQDHQDDWVQYFNDNNQVLKLDKFVTEPCKVFTRIFSN